jgi:hypothetical protein
MTININDLKNQAKQIDCCSFIKRRSPLRKPKSPYDGMEMGDLPEKLSKQAKIKLLTKNQY